MIDLEYGVFFVVFFYKIFLDCFDIFSCDEFMVCFFWVLVIKGKFIFFMIVVSYE